MAAGDPTGPEATPVGPPGRGRLTIDISGGAVAKIVVGLFLLGLFGGLLDRMRDILVWILAAAFLAVALNPLVEKLEPKIGRRPAATVVFLGFVIGFIAVAAAFVAPFVTQVDNLQTGIPQAISDAKHNSTVNRLDKRFHIAKYAKEHLSTLPNGRVRRRGHRARRRRRDLDRLLPDALPALRAARHPARGALTDTSGTPAAGRGRGAAPEHERSAATSPAIS